MTTIPVTDASTTDNPAPASTSCTGLFALPWASPRMKTAIPARPAPANPNQTYCAIVVRLKVTIPRITATAAPALIPSNPGSASGLRVTACMMAPAVPRAIPAMIATIVRGIRSSRTTRCSSFEKSGCHSAWMVSLRAIDREPRARLQSAIAVKTAAATIRPLTRLFCNGMTNCILFDVICENWTRQPRSSGDRNNSRYGKKMVREDRRYDRGPQEGSPILDLSTMPGRHFVSRAKGKCSCL